MILRGLVEREIEEAIKTMAKVNSVEVGTLVADIIVFIYMPR